MINLVKLGGNLSDPLASSGQFGRTVSISSDGLTVAVGHPYSDISGVDSGGVSIFNYISSTWTKIVTLTGLNASDNTGMSLSLTSNGKVLAIGELGASRVRIYNNSGTIWSLIGTINGPSIGTGSSVSLNLNGSIVAVGEKNFDTGLTNVGRVRIFRYSGSGISWLQIGAINGTAASNNTGYSVSLSSDGTIIAFGEPGYSNGSNGIGRVRIFRYASDNSWTQIGVINSTSTTIDGTGYSVSLSPDGTIVAVGEPGYSNDIVGRVRIFRYASDNSWTQIGVINSTSTDGTGKSVSLSPDGTIVAVGEPEYSNSIGRVRIFMYASDNSWNQIGVISGLVGQTGISVSLNGMFIAVGDLNAKVARVYNLYKKSKTKLSKLSGFLGRM